MEWEEEWQEIDYQVIEGKEHTQTSTTTYRVAFLLKVL